MARSAAVLAAMLATTACTDGADRGGFGVQAPVTASPSLPATPTGEEPAQQIKVSAPGGLRFDPLRLEFRAGAAVVIAFQNLDGQDHTFAIDELNVLMLAAPGQTVRAGVSIHRRNVGTFAFYCSIPGHREAGMEGTVLVRR